MRRSETSAVALLDIRLCASLPIVLLILVAIIIVWPTVWPVVGDVPGSWPVFVAAALSLLGAAGRTYIRVARIRRG
ncbi:hypothetical protein [Streptomyces chattanoogensis]|uniref:hypothetical protein n=1 Tax=Streptomyces chattanoogensis TaxID=66876 RepID=UPI0012FF2F07|nr:hypothetical protein [Streptomyces chattanoogensis]